MRLKPGETTRDRERQAGLKEQVREGQKMTCVSHQANSCGTAELIPAQPFSGSCPMSHFYFLEKEQRVEGVQDPGGTNRKDVGHAGHQTPSEID